MSFPYEMEYAGRRSFMNISGDSSNISRDQQSDSTDGQNRQQGGKTGRFHISRNIFNLGRTSTGVEDVDMERRISQAALNLFEGIQQIYMDKQRAREVSASTSISGSEDDWKIRLLELLGGSDNVVLSSDSSVSTSQMETSTRNEISDIDLLLHNVRCEKFVLRCVEQDLPPNLIYCLRMLRIIEVQHACTLVTNPQQAQPAQPLSRIATSKVSKLLCILCTDEIVGEQLRPHLFHLLKLSTQSYPPCGVHIASEVSKVALSFAKNCLTPSLVWFMHERAMIVIMLEDLKELLGMTSTTETVQMEASPSSLMIGDGGGSTELASTATPATFNHYQLYGKDAEKAGLWVIALETIVKLVTQCCNYQCTGLIKDFDSAGGYHVLSYAISNSKKEHAQKILPLVTALACCRTSNENTSIDNDPPSSDIYQNHDTQSSRFQDDMSEQSKQQNKDDQKFASNVQAFEIVEDLMLRSIPFFKHYVESHDGRRVDFLNEELSYMAEFSVISSVESISNKMEIDPLKPDEFSSSDIDLPSELLVTSLQIYSDHGENFNEIESNYFILSHYILAFPTFHYDEQLSTVKPIILKTLEYICTGVTSSKCMIPLRVACEIFISLCTQLLTESCEKLLIDAEMLCETLEKLSFFDDKVPSAMYECGLLGDKLNKILSLITNFSAKTTDTEDNIPGPPSNTDIDGPFSFLCRVLKQVVCNYHPMSDDFEMTSLVSSSSREPQSGRMNLHVLLTTGVKKLGDKSSQTSLSVFETILGKNSADSSTLQDDVLSLIDVLEHLASQTKKRYPINPKFCVDGLDVKSISREVDVVDLFTKIMRNNSNEQLQDIFRTKDGFETLVMIMFSLKNGFTDEVSCDSSYESPIIGLLYSIYHLLFAATSSNVQSKGNRRSSGDNMTQLAKAQPQERDLRYFESEVSSVPLPFEVNQSYLSKSGFFLEFTKAIKCTGILKSEKYAFQVLNLAFKLCHPNLQLMRDTNFGKKRPSLGAAAIKSLYYPDAIILVLGIAVSLPDSLSYLSKRALDEILCLCEESMSKTTLSQIAKCGIVQSLTSPNEFGFMLGNHKHALYSRFVLLLRRVAAFYMSYEDLISLLRNIAGPILQDNHLLSNAQNKLLSGSVIGAQSNDKKCNIKLPVITSVSSTASSKTKKHKKQSESGSVEEEKSRIQDHDQDICNRLETLCVIAHRGDNVSRCVLGGDDLNSVALYMQKVPIEERLLKLAEEGRLRYIQIPKLDSTAVTPKTTADNNNRGLSHSIIGGSTGASSSSNSEKIWPPLVYTGFSYSLWLRIPLDSAPQNAFGSLFLLDISSHGSTNSSSNHNPFQSIRDTSGTGMGSLSFNVPCDFCCIWYDLNQKQICVLTSSTPKNDPVRFSFSALRPGVWHHILITYQPSKRTLMNRKSNMSLHIDGRQIDADVKVDSLSFPPSSRVHIGVSNPILSASGIVRGSLPIWELGPFFLTSGVLNNKDAMSIFSTGPDFLGLFWGDSPQRLSLTATATSTFAMLSEIGEKGSVATALRRRQMPEIEATGQVIRGGKKSSDNNNLASVGLLCSINKDDVVFGYSAVSVRESKREKFCKFLINIARINHETVSTDALLLGNASRINPGSFADNIQWLGGTKVLLPLVNGVESSKSLALSLRLIRESSHRHLPNLEDLQSGGGYIILALLLRQKLFTDAAVMDQCFAFSVHGFEPGATSSVDENTLGRDGSTVATWSGTDHWVISDLHALKYLVLNHQVWDLRGSGPDLPLMLLAYLNTLVTTSNFHAAFNSRRLHLLGIVRWTLHLMLETSDLYAQSLDNPDSPSASKWKLDSPTVSTVAVGGDPNNPLLQCCKSLLRRVLTYILTPEDLRDVAGAIIYTLNITGGIDSSIVNDPDCINDHKLPPGPVARIYLLRLLEELVVDGVNEIVSANEEASAAARRNEAENVSEPQTIKPHAGGGTNTNQSYLSSTMGTRRKHRSQAPDVTQHPKHQQAQYFLSAFASILTPVWFACVLEGSQEEASASAALRLMVLLLQSSPAFSNVFERSGGFSPLVLSIPKFSTSPTINMTMLSQLLRAPILHLPCLNVLDAEKLMQVFDIESDVTELIINENLPTKTHSDPSCGIFALLAECLGRNIQLASYQNELGKKARATNLSVIKLLSHRHSFSTSFQEFCRTSDFLEPVAQALCLIYDEKMQQLLRKNPPQQDLVEDDPSEDDSSDAVMWSSGQPQSSSPRSGRSRNRRGSLSTTNMDESATHRFVGGDANEASGVGMVQLLHLVVSHAVMSGQLAAPLLYALFRSFPIHASQEQVEAFHLVLIENCSNVVKDALQRGNALSIANCIGISSVLLDRLMAGFFTSEPILETTNIIMTILRSLTAAGTFASRTLGATEQALLTLDAAHIARLTCLTALNRSRPALPYDLGDDDLKLEMLKIISINLRQLLSTQTRRGSNLSKLEIPQQGNRFYPIYHQASLTRCKPASISCLHPDLHGLEQPDGAFVVALMSELHPILLDRRVDIQEQAVVILVSLLQQRRGFMSDLLITEIPRNDNKVETVDLLNRGGFGALLVAHEHASISDNMSNIPRRISSNARGRGDRSVGIGKLKYASFFEWLERNQGQVAAVFQNVHIQASRLLPEIGAGAATPEKAVENEQKVMLLKMTAQDISDRTIQGGLERAEKAQDLYIRTAKNHASWKRQGFDDLSSGAMQWKILLRKLKGSFGIWEGGSYDDSESKNIRWKLDLTEGYERQRRRLLPNYEFQSLYNLGDEEDQSSHVQPSEVSDHKSIQTKGTEEEGSVDPLVNGSRIGRRGSILAAPESVEATSELLKRMQTLSTKDRQNSLKVLYDEDDDGIEAADDTEDEDDDHEGEGHKREDGKSAKDETQTENEEENASSAQPNDNIENNNTNTEDGEDQDEKAKDNYASSYDVITGILEPGDWPEKSYNVKRCTGCEVKTALLLWCRDALYIVDGFEKTEGDGLEGKINRSETSTSTFHINLRPSDFKDKPTSENSTHGGSEKDSQQASNGSQSNENRKGNRIEEKSNAAGDEVTYQHHSLRISCYDLYSVYRRRYQLQQIALEFYDVHRNGTLIAFGSTSERDEVLSKVLGSPLPNSIFAQNGMAGSTSINYNKFMNSLKAKITNQWVQGRMTNFDFIMHLNSFAGRSYNDLTQYPVFPWVLSDYSSEELDLENPASYRDLSKPMGAQSEERAKQFKERFEVLESNCSMNIGDPPPFHYGTHYSCAAYVLYYLMRLEPFSRLALRLQGGKFDIADRLFDGIHESWLSSSRDNLQDVRELIPEFFYLPEFLENSNMFDFGTKQNGKVVHNALLPPWAKGDPLRFIRLNRQALESEHVSRNLHKWCDLIFGYKQRGREAIKALNTFVHLTYEGQVDLDSITDELEREAAITFIDCFGQTPGRLERKPFPQKNIVVAAKQKSIDFSALSPLAALTPPFCIVGAPHRVYLRVSEWSTCRVGMAGQDDSSVGDLCYVRGQFIGVGKTCVFINPSKRYVRFGGPNNGVSIHVGVTSAKHREVNQVITIHDSMHRLPITVARPSLNGEWLVTGCEDSTVRVWRYNGKRTQLSASLCGHKGGKITCIDVSTTYGCIVTGGEDGHVLLWDLRRLTFVRELKNTSRNNRRNHGSSDTDKVDAVISVSINHKNGNILTLIKQTLCLFDINGNLLGTQDPNIYALHNRPSCAIATNCPEWMDKGVVAVTGHINGEIRLWSINYHAKMLVMRHMAPDKVHSCPITALRIPDEPQDTLLVGDKSGKISIFKTLKLYSLSQQEQNVVLQELKSGTTASVTEEIVSN